MQIPATIQTFPFAGIQVQAYVPSYSWMQENYQHLNQTAPFPYWAKVWPAARALCEVIAANPSLVIGKQVLELAAGLGLPSLLSAQFALTVTATDYIQDAVNMMQRSASLYPFNNMQCCLMDWNNCIPDPATELLLLSDVNYDPQQFDVLFRLLDNYINQGTKVLLSTPQRLAGKAFMQRLQPWCRQTYEIEIAENKETVIASVWLLVK